MYPKLAIIGRPNVGKSALFNRISGQRRAIVDEMEGVTRDRLEIVVDFFGKKFILLDTGGIHHKSVDLFNEEVKEQALLAIAEADVLLFVVDGQVGLTALDEEVAKIVHKSRKPSVLAVNKMDNRQGEEATYPFLSLGVQDSLPISAAHGYFVTELVEKALEKAPSVASQKEKATCRLTCIGRPNVGKSTLINTLLDDKRCIVSPIPGTTRDRIDIEFTKDGKHYTLVDTAGIRRKKSEKEAVDKFAFVRTKQAIEQADICLFMIEALQGLTHQEKRILQEIERAGKPCVLLINKWDLVHNVRMEHTLKALQEENPHLKHCPALVLSAKTGRNVEEIFPVVTSVLEEGKVRVGTGKLNTFLERTLQRRAPPMLQGKRLRIYYVTQLSTMPPTFIFFVNYTSLLQPSYERYLMNRLREEWPFKGYPLRFHFREKEREKLAGLLRRNRETVKA